MHDAEDLTLKDLIRYYEMETAVATAIKARYGSLDKIPVSQESVISTSEAGWTLVALFIIHPIWLLIVDQLFFDVWGVTEAIRDFGNKGPDHWLIVTVGMIFYVGIGSVFLVWVGECIHEYALKSWSRQSDGSIDFKYDLKKLVRELGYKWDKEDRDAKYSEDDLESIKRRREREREKPMREAWTKLQLSKHRWDLAFEDPTDEFKISYYEAMKYHHNPALRIVESLPSIYH